MSTISYLKPKKAEKVPPSHAYSQARVRIQTPLPLPCRFHFFPFAVCFFCWFIKRNPHEGKEGVITDFEWNPGLGRMVFEIELDDRTIVKSFNEDFELALLPLHRAGR